VNRQPPNVPPGGLASSCGGSPHLNSAHLRRTASVARAPRPQVRSPLRRGRPGDPVAAELLEVLRLPPFPLHMEPPP